MTRGRKPKVRPPGDITNPIAVIPYNEIDINFYHDDGFLAYSFNHKKEGEEEEKKYGRQLLITGRTVTGRIPIETLPEIVGIIGLLWLNAIETINSLKDEKPIKKSKEKIK